MSRQPLQRGEGTRMLKAVTVLSREKAVLVPAQVSGTEKQEFLSTTRADSE